MTTHREGIFVEQLWTESSPLSSSIPAVEEVGLTSAPLESMAFHFAQSCEAYNTDYMLCKAQSRDPKDCLAEGRKVTRCALDLIQKLKENCDEQWTAHWSCLDLNNHNLFKCRSQERLFNDCVFAKLGLTKIIPETPEGQEPIHTKANPLFK